MVVIIEYGMGNLYSVANALEAIGEKSCISNKESDIQRADKIILPGVGAFSKAMKHLDAYGLIPVLNREVLEKKKPILGICLGVQLFFEKSYEDGESKGLGWVNGSVRKIKPKDSSLKIPHIGWNEVVCKKDDPLFQGIDGDPNFYFVHSYFCDCDEKIIASKFEYGGFFTASIRKDNIFGTQFHPEKSQSHGLKVLKNFISLGGN